MLRIIALYGHQNCGKTDTLNRLCELIRNNGGVSLASEPPYSGDDPKMFEYKDMVVCICPGGDNGAVVSQNFEYAYSKNADILITASRTRGDSVETITGEGNKNGIKVEWFRKSYEYCLSEAIQQFCNCEYAKVILDEI